MTTVIPEGFAECSIRFTHSSVSRPAVITFGIAITADTQADINGVLGLFITDLPEFFDTAVTIGPATGRFNAGTGLISAESQVTPVTGELASAGPSPQLAVLVQKRTGFGGRTGRGRFYLPWCLGGGSYSEDGNIATGSISDLGAALNQYLSDLDSAGTNMMLLHDDEGAGATLDPMEVGLLDPQVRSATQRRRNRP